MKKELKFMPIVSQKRTVVEHQYETTELSAAEKLVEAMYPWIAGGGCVSMMIVLARMVGLI